MMPPTRNFEDLIQNNESRIKETFQDYSDTFSTTPKKEKSIGNRSEKFTDNANMDEASY